jgi:hypothetical protein
MSTLTRSTLAREVGVFEAPALDGVLPFFSEHGFAIVRGLYTEAELVELEQELERQQERLVAGDLP